MMLRIARTRAPLAASCGASRSGIRSFGAAAEAAAQQPPQPPSGNADARYQKKKERLERRMKTQLCEAFAKDGKCEHGSACWFAHGMAELRPAPHVVEAVQAKGSSGAPISAADLEAARRDAVLRRQVGLNRAINGLMIKKEAVSQFKYSDVKLDFTRVLEKVSLTIPIENLQNHWHLSTEQVTLLKAVVGPRYDVDKNSFRLVKRFRAPFTVEFDPDTSFDPLIETLCLLVSEVRKAAPPVYSFEQDVIPSETFPRISILPIAEESA